MGCRESALLEIHGCDSWNLTCAPSPPHATITKRAQWEEAEVANGWKDVSVGRHGGFPLDRKARRNFRFEFAASFQTLRRPPQPATARRNPLPICSLEAKLLLLKLLRCFSFIFDTNWKDRKDEIVGGDKP